MRKRSLHVAAGSVAILALSASLAVAVSTPVSFLDSSGNTKDVLPVQLDMGQPIIRDADPHMQEMGSQSWVPQVDVRVDGFVPEGYDHGDATKSNQLMQDLGINGAVPSQQPGIVGQNAGGTDSQSRPSTTVTVVIGDNEQNSASDSYGSPDGADSSYDREFDDSHSGGLYRVGSDDDQPSDENKDQTEVQDVQNVTFEMPEGADYKRDEALITISSDATPEEVEELLKSANGVVSQTVTQDDIEAGYVKVELEPGTSVEDAVNEVLSSDSTAVSGAQPNYVYRLMNDRGVEGLVEDIEANESMELPRLAGFYEWQQNQQAQALQAMGEGTEGEEEEQSDSDSQSDTITMGVQSEEEPTDTVKTAGGAMVMSTQSEAVYEEQQAAPQQVTYVEQEQTNVEPEEEPVETEQKTPEATESQDEQQVVTESQTNVEEPMPETLPEMIAQAEIARFEPNDSRFANKGQWALESIQAPEAWAITGEAKNVYVAVLDNGFDTSHEDLVDNLAMDYAYNSFTETFGEVSPDTTNTNHGTHVAGVVSARTNNEKGVAGVSYNAKIIPIKVFSDGEATSDSLIRAYQYLDKLRKQRRVDVRVANVSLGAFVNSINDDDNALLAIKDAFDAGLITVASAGNIGDNPSRTVPYREYPGDYGYIVSVVNLMNNGSGTNDASGKYDVSRYDGSNYNVSGQGGTSTNEGKNIAAPGTRIVGTVTNGDYASMTGTSMASPHVAGVLALEFALNPDLSAQDAINNLYQTAHDIGPKGWDQEYGWGEVNAYAAAEAVLGQIEDVIDNLTINASVVENSYDPEYDGNAKEPQIVVSYKENETAASKELDPELYSVSYNNNVDAGVGTARVTGLINVKGAHNPVNFTYDLSFDITQRPIAEASVTPSKSNFTFGRDAKVIDGAIVHVPTLTVRDLNNTLAGPTSGYKLVDKETVTAAGKDYDIKATGCTKAGQASIDVIAPVATIGNYKGSQNIPYTISKLPIKDPIVTASLDYDSYAYTGSQIQPKVMVTVSVDGQEIALKEGTDYTIEYGKNVEGTGSVTIVGKDNLSGSTTKTFDIVKPMADVKAVWDGDEFVYDGKGHAPSVTITDGEEVLVEGRDYELIYNRKESADNFVYIGSTKPKDAGQYKAIALGKTDSEGNGYAGSLQCEFTIEAAGITSAELSKSAATYNGLDQRPSATVYAGKMTLSLDDYDITYKRGDAETDDVKNVGSVSVFVTGKGNYQGTKNAGTFTISPLSIKHSSVTVEVDPLSYIYDGKEKRPDVIVKLKNGVTVRSNNYTVSYSDNTEVGTGKIKLEGKNNLTESREDITFEIEEAITPTTIDSDMVKWDATAFVYNGDEQVPSPKIVVGEKTLEERVDYTITYYRMNAAGAYEEIGSTAPTDAGQYMAVVMGKSDGEGRGFAGTVEHEFEIQAVSITSVELSKESVVYNGRNQKPSLTVYAKNKTLSSSDYTVTYTRGGVETADFKNAGTIDVSVKGKGNYKDTVNTTFTISPLSINNSSVKATLTPASYTYDGTAKYPRVVVTAGGVVVPNGNYAVTYLNNTNVGTGKVRLTGTKSLEGVREETFTIYEAQTPPTPEPADTTTETTTPITSTYDPYINNLLSYLRMRRAMQDRYWYGYGNYWDPYDYYQQQMLMRQWMLYMLRPYGWYGSNPSQAYQPYYSNSYYGQPRYGYYGQSGIWNPWYGNNNNPWDYSYNGFNPYAYRNYGYRAPYMDVYPVSVRRGTNYYEPIRTVSPFSVDSDLYDVTYQKVSGEPGIYVNPRTGEMSVNPYVQPGTYDVGVRVSGYDRITGRSYSDIMNTNVYVR